MHSNLHHCKFVHQFIKDVAATRKFGVKVLLANADYHISENIAAVRNYGDVAFQIVSLEEALSGDFAESRNVAIVRTIKQKIVCAVPGAHTAPGGAAAILMDGSVFIHQSGIGGWLRAEVL